MLSLMELFTPEHSEWTIEAMVTRLGLSPSTVYRYVRSLVSVGLIFSARPGTYLLGPGIAYYDRQFRLADPLIRASQSVLRALANEFTVPGILFIARIYRRHLMSMAEQPLGLDEFPTSFARGRLLPIDTGAPALAITAFTPIRSLKKEFFLYHAGPEQLSAWRTFKRELRLTRTRGYAFDPGHVDAHASYISVPLLRGDGEVAGSLSVGVLREQATATWVALATARLTQAVSQIERLIELPDARHPPGAGHATP
jgi:DNA-binding IclR family transcriptional regulator